jgi:diguanylate cyclase (GGDEF)-like protein
VDEPKWHFGRPPVPRRAVLISAAALAVPVLAGALGVSDGSAQLLLWLLALVPAFLLAYYRGWRGVATSLAMGMAGLALSNAGALLLGHSPGGSLAVGIVIVAFLALSLGIGFLSDLLHAARAQAERLALTDDLTGLANRRHARMTLEREFAAAQRGRPLSVVMLDLDHFKAYNDRHGHREGDVAVRAFGEALAKSTRQMDLSARYGGEEFLVILSSSGLDGAQAFARRLRAAFAAHPGNIHGLTVSAGLATYNPTMRSMDELIVAADQAMYLAKQGGRDRAHSSPEPVPVG